MGRARLLVLLSARRSCGGRSARLRSPSTTTVATADFAADFAAIRHVRFTVFVDEQGVPEDIELDDRDRSAARACIRRRAGRHRPHRRRSRRQDRPRGGARRGARPRRRHALMHRLHDIAAEARAGLWCNAQISAVPFYARLGYV